MPKPVLKYYFSTQHQVIMNVLFINALLFCSFLFQTTFVFADPNSMGSIIQQPTSSAQAPHANPLIIPTPPNINAKGYILIDVDSGKILAEKNSDTKLPPASLTKMMTLYVISNALKHEQIHLNDTVRISQTAWKTGGSRMFIKEGQQVHIKDLLKGIIVDSGNDACVAMAEHLGGSEEGFSQIMNQQAMNLGMTQTHFTDSTGLPNPELYTTAKDLAILGSALIKDFPEYYHWYKQKWFTYNGIRQPNRNRLLWRDEQVDGIKTGHTNDAGFCLVASAKHDNMRLLSVVLGAPSDGVRADDSERLLNYGFRFYETHALYKANQVISSIDVYKSINHKLNIGLLQNEFITIPSGQYQRLNLSTNAPKFLKAPINRGDKIGDLIVKLDEQIIANQPLYALENAPTGSLYTRAKDSMRLVFKHWWG